MITKKSNVWFKIIFFSIVTVLIGIVSLANYVIRKENDYKDKIYPGLFIDKMDFGNYTKEEVIDFFEDKNRSLSRIQINVVFKNQIEATLSGQLLNFRYPSRALADQAYLVGRSEQVSSRIHQKLVMIFRLSSFQINTELEYDKDAIGDFLDNMAQKYNKPAKNALFAFENGKVTSFRKEEYGAEINSDKVFADLEKIRQELKNNVENRTVIVNDRIIKPEITLAQANNLGIEEFIGEGVSDYTHSIPERIYNLTLATRKFHGVLIPKDSVFSFNSILGDVSAKTGYKQAYIIKEGKTVLGDGGGVCQVSTTFFRAALNSGLPIVERTAHAYRVSYYENDSKPGFDATVYLPSPDLKIKNDTASYILIQTEINETASQLFFRFYGKNDGRISQITNIKLTDVSPPPEPLYQDDPSLKKGVTKQIDYAAWGGKASFDYAVRRDSETVFQKSFYSYYKPWRAVYLVGTAD